MISTNVFFKIEPIVAGDFVLKTAGNFESQSAFAGTGCFIFVATNSL